MNQPSWGGRFMRLPHGGGIACPQVRDYKESTRSHQTWTVGWRDLLCQKGVCFLKNLRTPYSAPLDTQLVGFWKAVLVSLKCCQAGSHPRQLTVLVIHWLAPLPYRPNVGVTAFIPDVTTR